MTRLESGWLILLFVATGTSSAIGQDISWTQPYSGNIVYGPLSPDPGPIPLCPDCDCETCQPGGSKGFFKHLFGGARDHVRTTRRECYYHNQLYHTKYTPPVLPPYCEVGYGYYQTSWRQPAICPDPLEHSGGYASFPAVGVEIGEPVIPAPAPMPMLPGNDPQVNPQDGLENEADGKREVPAPPSSDEKPRYEEPQPKTGEAGWKQVTPLARQFYRGPVITPR